MGGRREKGSTSKRSQGCTIGTDGDLILICSKELHEINYDEALFSRRAIRNAAQDSREQPPLYVHTEIRIQ